MRDQGKTLFYAELKSRRDVPELEAAGEMVCPAKLPLICPLRGPHLGLQWRVRAICVLKGRPISLLAEAEG